MKTNVTPSAQLAFFAAELNYDDIPTEVMRRAEDLFLDWFGSALAGKSGARCRRSKRLPERWARRMAAQRY